MKQKRSKHNFIPTMDFVQEMYVLGGEVMNKRDELRMAFEARAENDERIAMIEEELDILMNRSNDLIEKERRECNPKTAPKRKLCMFSGQTDPKTNEVVAEHMHFSDTCQCPNVSIGLVRSNYEKVMKVDSKESKRCSRKQMEEVLFKK